MANSEQLQGIFARNGGERPHVVIVGAGFGGLWAARQLAETPVRVTLLDRNNYHTFLPLLYQVAAAELEPEQIGYPVRAILRRMPNVHFRMAEVTGVDLEARQVQTTMESISYDYLILAAGSVSRFFGIPGAAEHAYSLKTMEEGIQLRNQILRCFETAVHEPDPQKRRELLTFVVVGGGPTGVEYAGALTELIDGPLARDYPQLDMSEVRVMLVEAAAGVLNGLPQKLGSYARERLAGMGVDVRLDTAVSSVTARCVQLNRTEEIPTRTVVWTAGVGGNMPAHQGELLINRNGTISVSETLQLPGYAEVFAVGDMAHFEENDRALPMVAPVATQQGTLAAENLLRLLQDEPLQPFRYKDRGAMATIGRNAAVTHIFGRSLTGFFAWIIWLAVHVVNLIGFRNRMVVLINWAWSYLFYERMVRLILPTSLDGQDLKTTVADEVTEPIAEYG